MQYIRISRTTTLEQLTDMVGSRNVDVVLNYNSLDRVPNIGEAFYQKCQSVILKTNPVDPQRRDVILKQLAKSAEVFEYAALLNEDGWKVLSELNTFPSMLFVPNKVELPNDANIVGNDGAIGVSIYSAVIAANINPPHYINPSILNNYDSEKSTQIVGNGFSEFYNTSYVNNTGMVGSRPNQVEPTPTVFKPMLYRSSWQVRIPYTDIALYSTLSNEYVYFPVYPEELSDAVKANYTTMPDVLYQYEPWQIYQSSGDRSNSYSFFWHRDIWGDHTSESDETNKIIRFCEANCYPKYNGSAVNTSIVRLYFKGKILISGILTGVNVDWSGPLGHDDWYLCCKLTLSITEISETPLNYDVVKAKGLIG